MTEYYWWLVTSVVIPWPKEHCNTCRKSSISIAIHLGMAQDPIGIMQFEFCYVFCSTEHKMLYPAVLTDIVHNRFGKQKLKLVKLLTMISF